MFCRRMKTHPNLSTTTTTTTTTYNDNNNNNNDNNFSVLTDNNNNDKFSEFTKFSFLYFSLCHVGHFFFTVSTFQLSMHLIPNHYSESAVLQLNVKYENV